MGKVLWVALALLVACQTQAVDDARPGPVEDAPIDRIVELLEELEGLAEENDGTRYAGSPGYDASVDWVAEHLRAAGYDVSLDSFETSVAHPEPGSTVRVGGTTLEDGRDLRVLLYSPAGEASGPLHALDFAFDVAGRVGPACEDSAFVGMPEGSVVLIRPGPCFTRDQVVNASEAGAAAILISYPEFHTGTVLRPTLISPEAIDIPAFAISDEMGETFALEHEGDRVRVDARTRIEQVSLDNVIAEGTGGDPSEVVMFGGHLDSVVDGPGINDNGSGVATLIAVAEELDHDRTDARVRFAFWGAEELGLLGSTAYAQTKDLSDVVAYVNLDMLASPNFARWIYDEPVAPPGSDEITALFEEYFDEANLTSRLYSIAGSSDHGPFIRAGVPVGGVYSGSDEIKTPYLQRLFHGEAGEPMDPCYHRACDDITNINRSGLEDLAGAAAYVLDALAN